MITITITIDADEGSSHVHSSTKTDNPTDREKEVAGLLLHGTKSLLNVYEKVAGATPVTDTQYAAYKDQQSFSS